MRTLFSWLVCILLLASCAQHYEIAGNSFMEGEGSRMLYLNFTSDGVQHSCLDSCEVIHGQFSLSGDVDSIMMAHLFLGSQRVMPIVLENGRMDVQISNAFKYVKGGPLNDRLYDFFKKKEQLENDLWELERKCMSMLRDGKNVDEVKEYYARKEKKLSKELEDLETDFITDNYENVLGTGIFMILCNQYPSPVMTEQISKILHRAPSVFRNNPFVQSYERRARGGTCKCCEEEKEKK